MKRKMTASGWLVAFAATAVLLALLLAGFNWLTDPFGVFGDPVLGWWSADMTNNPRTAKISYLADHWDDYDSYLVGCSSTSSFPKAAFDGAFDAQFYNLIVYGADMLDSEETIRYLIAHDDVKNIVLNVYIDNAVVYDDESNPYTHSMTPAVDGSDPIPFYARFLFANPAYGFDKLKNRLADTWLSQPFDVFDEVSGSYDKVRRDAEPIGDLEHYLEAYPVFADYPTAAYTMPHADDCVESVGRIAALCRENGVSLTVVTAPVYQDYLAYFDLNEVKAFWRALADVTDFWDFSATSVSTEPRWFYDGTHFRNAVGEMAAARIAGDDSVWMPDDFGTLVTAENADAYLETYGNPVPYADLTAEVPVLMYHHLSGSETGDMIVSPDAFREQMEALTAAGYETVSLDELYGYVVRGEDLPEKPVVITFDDGYRSNYELAYPVLRSLGMKAVIFPIGAQLGCDTYKNDGEHAIYPHFGLTEAEEMRASGLVEIQSHTYDLHQASAYEAETARENMAALAGESEADWLDVLRLDAEREKEALSMGGENPVFALAFPSGVQNDEIRAAAVESGMRVMLTTETGTNTLIRGLPQSLYGLRRITVGEMSGADLLGLLEP